MSSEDNNKFSPYKGRMILTEKTKKIKKLNQLTSQLPPKFRKKLKISSQNFLDEDKINLENTKLFSDYLKKLPSEYNIKKQNNYNNEHFSGDNNIFIKIEKTNKNDYKNLFDNKNTRECNRKFQINQIYIKDYSSSFLNNKKPCFSFENKAKILCDTKIKNTLKEKKILLKELKFKDKINCNNKFNLSYRSQNLKKIQQIKKNFSLIKKTKNFDLLRKKFINKYQNLYNVKRNDNMKSLIFRCITDVKIKKKDYNLNLKRKLNEKKNKIYKPILSRTHDNNNISSEKIEKIDSRNFICEIDVISSSRKNFDNSFFQTQMKNL